MAGYRPATEEEIKKYLKAKGIQYDPAKHSSGAIYDPNYTEPEKQSVSAQPAPNNSSLEAMQEQIKVLMQNMEVLQKTLDNERASNVQLKQQIQVLQQKGANMSDSNQPVQTQQAAQQWEYKRGSFSDNELNKLGEEGWEVISDYNGCLSLKRPKQQQKAPQRNDYYGYGR